MSKPIHAITLDTKPFVDAFQDLADAVQGKPLRPRKTRSRMTARQYRAARRQYRRDLTAWERAGRPGPLAAVRRLARLAKETP